MNQVYQQKKLWNLPLQRICMGCLSNGQRPLQNYMRAIQVAVTISDSEACFKTTDYLLITSGPGPQHWLMQEQNSTSQLPS